MFQWQAECLLLGKVLSKSQCLIRSQEFFIFTERFQGGYCFGIVRLKPFRLSVTLFGPNTYLGLGFSKFIVILQEYVLSYEDSLQQVCLHCTYWK